MKAWLSGRAMRVRGTKERRVLFEYSYKTYPTHESVMQHKETCHVTLVDHTHTKK